MESETLVLDVDFEQARAVHRVVRAMHDGECPRCHTILPADHMRISPQEATRAALRDRPPQLTWDLICPACDFTITHAEQQAAFQLFAPVMERNLAVFEEWRAGLTPPI